MLGGVGSPIRFGSAPAGDGEAALLAPIGDEVTAHLAEGSLLEPLVHLEVHGWPREATCFQHEFAIGLRARALEKGESPSLAAVADELPSRLDANGGVGMGSVRGP